MSLAGCDSEPPKRGPEKGLPLAHLTPNASRTNVMACSLLEQDRLSCPSNKIELWVIGVGVFFRKHQESPCVAFPLLVRTGRLASSLLWERASITINKKSIDPVKRLATGQCLSNVWWKLNALPRWYKEYLVLIGKTAQCLRPSVPAPHDTQCCS